MKRPMAILTDSSGLPAPQADRRWVPVSTMAAYEGVTANTVYTRMLAGYYPADGLQRSGRDVRYCPAILFAQRGAASSP